jgi:hypothetical protein
MTSQRFQMNEGMDVVGSDGGHIGKVKEVRADDLLIDRRMQLDVYVPFSAIRDVVDDRVVLTVAELELDYIASVSSPITGGPGETYEDS